MQIKDLKQDKRNYRKHNQRNLDLIKKSVTEVGLGRSVVIDNENEIVCGNGLVSTLDKDTPIKVIETDGSELVVVKRTDLATNDDKRKQLAIMDNSTSESSEWDFEKLEADFDTEELEDWGLDVDFAIEEEENIDIEEIDNYNEGYNIIIKCANYDEAEKFNKKYNLNLDFDNQRIVINVEKML
jgi:hypothetical protein